MDKLLLVDGHNLLFRMFYGMPDHFRTPSGIRYNAVYGFGNALAAVIADLGPTHALVLFDTEECGERRSLDAAYKANRPDYSEMEEDELPFPQIPAICALLDACGIPHAEARGCEADDLIASYALASCGDKRVTILSTDRDYWQLIGERISVAIYQHGVTSIVDPTAVKAKFGVTPEQFTDWKCLVGDSSDNIAGVPGIGPKTAAELLSAYGTVEGIYEHLGEIRRAKIRDSLGGSRERIALNRRLIALTGGHPLPVETADCVLTARFPGSILTLARECAEACATNGAD
ncbi:MAG: 5'-3' exonuclease [Clostridia bacterium]|nr:5'-3' exonuclease [Clostridia bacterium]